jgi:hypothetical protein
LASFRRRIVVNRHIGKLNERRINQIVIGKEDNDVEQWVLSRSKNVSGTASGIVERCEKGAGGVSVENEEQCPPLFKSTFQSGRQAGKDGILASGKVYSPGRVSQFGNR